MFKNFIVFTIPFLAVLISFLLALSETAFGSERGPRRSAQGATQGRAGEEIHLDPSFFYSGPQGSYGGAPDQRSGSLFTAYRSGTVVLYSTSEFTTLEREGYFNGPIADEASGDFYPGTPSSGQPNTYPAPSRRGPWEIRDGRQGFGRDTRSSRQAPIYCYAQGSRGETFTGRGYNVHEVQRQVLNSCRTYTPRCRPLGCNY